MARARNIKPGFFKNADLVELPVEARLLFVGLWTLADRAGRLEDRPKQIKMELFPADAVDVDAALNGLQQWGFLKRYEIEGRRLIQVTNFTKHQNPHRDEKLSVLPDEHGQYDKPKESHDAGTVQAQCKDEAETVQIVLNPDSLIPDSSTVEAAERQPRASRLPNNWVLPDEWSEWARAERPDLDPIKTAEQFRDYWSAKPGKDGRKVDWLATWRNWVRNQRAAKPTTSQQAHAPPITVASNAAERTKAEMAERMAPLTPEQQAAAEVARREAMARFKPRSTA